MSTNMTEYFPTAEICPFFKIVYSMTKLYP